MTHPTHKTHLSDSSLYDEKCDLCGVTDRNGWAALSEPCSSAAQEQISAETLARGRELLAKAATSGAWEIVHYEFRDWLFDNAEALLAAASPPAGGSEEKLREALRPFANAVFHDNGDVTYDYSRISRADYWRAYQALRHEALAATPSPPAGGEQMLGEALEALLKPTLTEERLRDKLAYNGRNSANNNAGIRVGSDLHFAEMMLAQIVRVRAAIAATGVVHRGAEGVGGHCGSDSSQQREN